MGVWCQGRNFTPNIYCRIWLKLSKSRCDTTPYSAGHQYRLSSLWNLQRSRIYQRSIQDDTITSACMLFWDSAAVLISRCLRVFTRVHRNLCFGTLPKPNKPNMVALIVQGQLLDVLKDTGSDKSCVDHGKALELGLELSYSSDAPAQFRLPDGQVISHIATAWVECSANDNIAAHRLSSQFYVFESLPVPMLLGNDLVDRSFEIRWQASPYSELPRARMDWHVPLHVDGKQIGAVIDTGADGNFISMAVLTSMGYQLDRKKERKYIMANGKVIKSLGDVRLECQLPYGNGPRSAVFQVLEVIEGPAILGAELAFQWGLIFHAAYCRLHDEFSGPRVTHLSREGHGIARHFRCHLNNRSIKASADTGSDLNLISPSTVSRVSDTSSIRAEDIEITLLDGSKAHIHGSISASLSPNSAPQETITERFYILEGLIADVFLGWRTLDKIGAFTTNKASFSDSLEEPMLYNLNVAAHLSGLSAKILNKLRFDRRARTKTKGFPAKPTLQILPPPSTTDGDFYKVLKIVAAYECHCREKARIEITGLSGERRTAAEDTEKMRIERYEADLESRLAERRARR